MKLSEEERNHLTAKEYQWCLDNVSAYKNFPIAGEQCVMLILKNGNIVLGSTIEEAVRMEMEGTGELMSIDVSDEDLTILIEGV